MRTAETLNPNLSRKRLSQKGRTHNSNNNDNKLFVWVIDNNHRHETWFDLYSTAPFVFHAAFTEIYKSWSQDFSCLTVGGGGCNDHVKISREIGRQTNFLRHGWVGLAVRSMCGVPPGIIADTETLAMAHAHHHSQHFSPSSSACLSSSSCSFFFFLQ